jgi:alpha-galactosidase
MRTTILLLAISISGTLWAQDYASVSEGKLELNNGRVIREIRMEKGSFSSSVLRLPGEDWNYIRKSREFSFLANGQVLDGFSAWDLIGTERISDERQGQGLKVVLEGSGPWKGLQVEISYLLYPDMPLVRKWIRLVNHTAGDLRIEALNVEDLQTSFSQVQSVIHHNYARMKHLGSFVGDWYDPVVVLHHQSKHLGMALGNEAPGILKRTAYHTVHENLEVGLTHPGQDYAFRKWLAPGETWESPKTFICLYRGSDDGFAVVDGAVNDFVRKHMHPQIIRNQNKPVFIYNTWNPFRTFVNDSLVREVALAAAQCGIMEFVIDDGWQVNRGAESSSDAWGNNYGDWIVDEEKFPGGLKPTFDYIDSLGMKPGLWMSVGSATSESAVYREHPEWFVKNNAGEHGNIHGYGEEMFTSCFGTGWVDYIREILVRMTGEHGLAYAKLDFAVAASAYVNDPARSGCYATDHPLHRDHQESFTVIYERVLELFDQLHRECPDLFLDCTFETAGKLQLMDYAIANHADGNWLSNFEEPYPTGPLRIRQMAWWRSPAVPASSLVIGNTRMDDPGFEFALKSLIGTLPIALGDPRLLEPEQRLQIKHWSEWMQEMQEKYDYMSYRRDLPGFGEPGEGHWDGWMRINNDTQAGGIVGIFKQNAFGEQRQVVLKGLESRADYVVKLAPGGKVIHAATGGELMHAGFAVHMEDPVDARIYEISRIGTQ